jgi:hypothetical protein
MSTSDNSSLQGTPGGKATFGMLARATIQRSQITTNVAMPGIVTAWRPPVSAGSESKPAMVDVRPDFKYARAIDVDDSAGPSEEVRDDPTRGKLAIGTLPVIPNVPVCYLGSGGMQVRGPIEIGECGLIVFCDRDIDDWIQDGGPAEPIMRHARHALINAIFIPGLRYGTVAHPVDPLIYFVGREDQTAGMSLHAESKDLRLFTEGANAEIDALTSIKLGMAALLGVARETDSVSASGDMTLFMATVVTALTAIAAAVPVIIVPPVPPAVIGTISTASTKVSSE